MPELAQLFIFVASLVVLIIGLTHLSMWLGVGESKDEEEKNWYRDPETHARPEDHDGPSVAIIAHRIDALGNEIYAQRRQQKHHENIRSRLEKLGVVAAIVAAVLAGWSAWIFQGQLAAMQDEQRPWIKIVGMAFDGPLIFDEAGAHVIVNLTIQNIGHSPAVRVWFERDMMPLSAVSGDSDVISAQERLCKARRRKPTGPHDLGFVLFPDDRMTQTLSATISKSDVDKAAKNPIKGMKGAFTIYFFGCVDYTFSFADAHHQTPFVYEFDKRAGLKAWEFEHFDGDDKEVTLDKLTVLTNPQVPGHTD